MNQQTALFGGGCFWCTEAVFQNMKGVLSVLPGYAGGSVKNPSYEQVCRGDTGHVEVIKIEYDEDLISYDDLLKVFFATHNPTTRNRQGNDTGSQYQSTVFYMFEKQHQKAVAAIFRLNHEQIFDNPIVTEVRPYINFFEAEEYHKNYYEEHKDMPYCSMVILPKLAKLHQQFPHLLEKETESL